MIFALIATVAVLTIVTVAVFADRLGVAAPLILVVVGLGASFIPHWSQEFDPEIILIGVLPPLLYSAAVNVPIMDFRRNLTPISVLSVLLVLGSAVATGVVLHLIIPTLPLAGAIALGAVISPTDAVAATSMGKRLGLPPRLVTLLEGEGLVNDAAALVLLRSAVAAVGGVVTIWGAVGDFVYAVAAAILIGAVVGIVIVRLRAKLNDPVLTTAISFAVPFIAYLPVEAIGASGVLSTVVAGLVMGHKGQKYLSPQDRLSERTNWQTVQFMLENAVFLMMGLELTTLVSEAQGSELGITETILIALLLTAVLVVLRFAVVAPLIHTMHKQARAAEGARERIDQARDRLEQMPADSPRVRRVGRFLTRREADADFAAQEGLGWRGGAVLSWSGMRGVVTLAAAQTLPSDLPFRPQLILIAFSVAIITLLVQGGTLPLVIRLVALRGPDSAVERADFSSLISEITAEAVTVLDDPDLRLPSGTPYDPETVDRVRADSLSLSERLDRLHSRTQDDPIDQYHRLRSLVLAAEREALLEARSIGAHSSRALNRALHLLDLEEFRLGQIEKEG